MTDPTIICPVCETVNPATRTFCLKCGSQLGAAAGMAAAGASMGAGAATPEPAAMHVDPVPTAPIPAAPITAAPATPEGADDGDSDGGGSGLPRLAFSAGIGIGAALLLFLGVVMLGGSPSASPTPASALGSPSPGASLDSGTPGPSDSGAPSIVPATLEPTLAPTAPPTAPPTAAPTAAPTPNTNPQIVTWDVPTLEDCTNSTKGMIHVKWSVKNATGVTISIDGPGIYDSYGKSGEIDLPYGCDHVVLKHTYTLRTTGGTGPAAVSTKTVKTRAPSIVSFTVDAPDCSGGDPSVGVSMGYEIRAATGVTLYRDGVEYTSYNVKKSGDIILYDCSKTYQTFRIVTYGGFGKEASKTITVYKT